MRLNYYIPPENAAELDGCPTGEDCGYKISEVKALVRKYGGRGFSEHIGRDGTLYECTPITLGNNAVRMSNCQRANYSS